MTDTPTLAAMLEWLEIASEMQSEPGNAMMMRAIRTRLAEHDDRTLPELPEGFKYERIQIGSTDNTGRDLHTVSLLGVGSPREMAEDAIAIHKRYVAKINQTEG